MNKILISLALFLFSASVFADNCFRGPCKLADLPTCDTKMQGREFLVKNCSTKISCATTGIYPVKLVCDDGAYRAVNATATAADLGDYALLAGATFTGGIRTATLIEHKVTDVTVADDGAGTKPAAVIPITTDFVTCTCNDATGCAASVAEPTPTAGYGRSLTILSNGTGTCEFTTSAGVIELGDTPILLQPKSVVGFVYMNSAWYAAFTHSNAAVE